MALPPVSDDARGFLRNVGWITAGFAVFMLVVTAFLRYAGMLWMDVPLLLLGAGLVAYSFAAPARGTP